ncbi:MAG TPA: chalcone isomerase family protein [Burkholderiaceae bacterium]|jgi:hypothetical protein
MRSSTSFVLAVSAAWLGLGAHAATVEIDGMKYETIINVVAQDLMLNGVGTKRSKQGAHEFTVALYLKSKSRTPGAVLAAPGAKSLRFKFLSDVNSDAMGFLTNSVQGNMAHDEFIKAMSGLMRLGTLMGGHPRFKKGDSITLEYHPGNGTSLAINDIPQGAPIAGDEFFKAMLLVWLGPRPLDDPMKVALLGG